jgi:hypothetical protein
MHVEKNFSILQIKQLLYNSSSVACDVMVRMVFENPLLMKPLLAISLQQEEPWCQRASRVITVTACKFPEIIKPFASLILKKLFEVKSESVRRNFLKIFADVDIKLSQKEQSLLLDHCIDYVSGSYPIAVRVYGMEVLFRLSLKHPDLQKELHLIISDQMTDTSVAVKSRGKRILKKLGKLQINFH